MQHTIPPLPANSLPANSLLATYTVALPSSPVFVTPDQWEVISLLGNGDIALGLHLILDAGMQRIIAKGDSTMTLRRDLNILRDRKLHLMPTSALVTKYNLPAAKITQILKKHERNGTPI